MLSQFKQAGESKLATVFTTIVFTFGIVRQMQFMQKIQLAMTGLTTIFMMGVVPTAALAAPGDNVPCNNFLSGLIKTPLDPIIGAFVGLKSLFPELIAVSIVLGILAYRSRHGKKLIEYGLVLAAGGVFLTALFAAFGHYVKTGC
jgi:hypothetical protein